MTARDLVTYSLPHLTPQDTGSSALELMEEFKVSHLPLVDGDRYITLVSEDEIYDKNLEDTRLADARLEVFRPYVNERQSVFDVLTLLAKIKTSVLPVLGDKEQYLGSILVADLIFDVIRAMGLDEDGAVITVKVKKHDYSVSHIGQIIEANNAKILSLFTIDDSDSHLKVVIKLNTRDVVSLIQTFERYDYEVESVLYDDEKYKQLYQERLDALMSYLKI